MYWKLACCLLFCCSYSRINSALNVDQTQFSITSFNEILLCFCFSLSGGSQSWHVVYYFAAAIPGLTVPWTWIKHSLVLPYLMKYFCAFVFPSVVDLKVGMFFTILLQLFQGQRCPWMLIKHNSGVLPHLMKYFLSVFSSVVDLKAACFYHFVGAVPGSTDLEQCIKRLLKELNAVNVSRPLLYRPYLLV